ncbi:uncharacterized protein LOC133862977 [Alnus glutinosa]|uniref:uncharacterized protein LOC133862977 n=1 Tax=Alnus glutinosa TaxID=3517 RepID=UPI002D77B8A7|nr:uncharacterized protein LOC133862977 [Alnus glutinosa]
MIGGAAGAKIRRWRSFDREAVMSVRPITCQIRECNPQPDPSVVDSRRARSQFPAGQGVFRPNPEDPKPSDPEPDPVTRRPERKTRFFLCVFWRLFLRNQWRFSGEFAMKILGVKARSRC